MELKITGVSCIILKISEVWYLQGKDVAYKRRKLMRPLGEKPGNTHQHLKVLAAISFQEFLLLYAQKSATNICARSLLLNKW